MAKTEQVTIKCEPEDRERMRAAAEAEHLGFIPWARRTLLLEADRILGPRPKESPPVP